MAGLVTVGSSRLFLPPSTMRIEREGSAKASRPAIMHAAVPPVAYGNQNTVWLLLML